MKSQVPVRGGALQAVARSNRDWIARCAARLGERWRTVPVTELEGAPVDVWRDEQLRTLPPDEAAARWLSPVGDQAAVLRSRHGIPVSREFQLHDRGAFERAVAQLDRPIATAPADTHAATARKKFAEQVSRELGIRSTLPPSLSWRLTT